MLLETISDDDMRAVFQKLVELARGGDVTAIKLLLAYAIGKPAEAVDPDVVDLKELRQYQECSTPPREMARVLGGLPPEMVCGLVRLLWPVTAQATVEPMRQAFKGDQKAAESELGAAMPAGSETRAERANADAEGTARSVNKTTGDGGKQAAPSANGAIGEGPQQKRRRPGNGAAGKTRSQEMPPPVDPPRPEDEELLRQWLGVDPIGNGDNRGGGSGKGVGVSDPGGAWNSEPRRGGRM
jgi:hypothetical protein